MALILKHLHTHWALAWSVNTPTSSSSVWLEWHSVGQSVSQLAAVTLANCRAHAKRQDSKTAKADCVIAMRLLLPATEEAVS